MVTLDIYQLGKRFAWELFSGVDLHGRTGDKIGLIGDNGSGKSTFLKILANLETAGEGTVQWSRGAKVGYLEQEPGEDTLSGGEKKILRISELFYGDYDALLLDEPDNHLDIEHKAWFSQLVKEFTGLLVVISHDRSFLETSVNKIWYLDEQMINQYEGSYVKFREVYEANMVSRQHLWEVQEKERLRLQDAVKRFRVMAASNSKLAGRYRGMVKRYDKWVAEMVTRPEVKKNLKIDLQAYDVHRKKTALYIPKINLHIFCGEKVAIVAPNGTGKSTLIKMILGKIANTLGEIVVGAGLKVGYYSQEHLEALGENNLLTEEISLPHYDAVGYLKKFMFSEMLTKMQVKRLSGGQKARLQLAKFLLNEPDLLILDEPTNHMDLRTVLALENFLKDYNGTLLLVSHDQKLVENVCYRKFLLDRFF